MNKKLRKNWLKIIIALFIIIYLVFDTNSFNELKGNVYKTSKNISEISNNVDEDFSNSNLTVYFIDVGQADAILIKSGDHNMLIDAGNNEDGVKLVNYLKENNVSKFDYVIATHAHEDHIGGMDDIINNFEIDKFFMPDKVAVTKTFEDVLDALSNKNMMYDTVRIDEEFSFSDSIIKVLYVGEENNNLNDTSIIVKVIHGNNSFLFTGDASSSVEQTILNKDIKSDVLKVAHHGSNYSSSKEFIDKVNPIYAVISVGKNNIYKHPSDIVINRLNDKNIKIYRTDRQGTIIMSSNGSNITVNTVITDTNG